MARAREVLEMLLPQGGYIQYGEEYADIQFVNCTPISEKDFNAGFAQYDAWKTKKEADAAKAKSELLAKLGITEDEAKLLLS